MNKSTKILIIEDERLHIDVLAGILKPKYKVTIAKSGNDALANIRASSLPDLILTDVMMPGMTGYEVCARLKADSLTRDIPVIFISALSDVAEKLKGFSAGGVDYVTKPFQAEEVMARVETHIALREMQKCLTDQNFRLQQEITGRKKVEQALQKAKDELEIRVQERTAELAQANKELKKARDDAESASRAKTEFLSNISHELKTPLSPIVGMTALALMSDTIRGQEREFLECVQNSAADLSNIIDDLIELSRIEADGIASIEEAFHLTQTLESILEPLMGQIKGKKLSLNIHVNPDVPEMIIGDPEILGKILIRLGGNAVKFTEKGGIVITVSTESENSGLLWLHFQIKDTGIGITAGNLKKLFQDFTQVDGSSTRKYGGMGMGLTMVKRMVVLMDGKLWAESVQGQGSVFHFILPFKTA